MLLQALWKVKSAGMTPMEIAMTTLLSGICLAGILAATMMLILSDPTRNAASHFTIKASAFNVVVALVICLTVGAPQFVAFAHSVAPAGITAKLISPAALLAPASPRSSMNMTGVSLASRAPVVPSAAPTAIAALRCFRCEPGLSFLSHPRPLSSSTSTSHHFRTLSVAVASQEIDDSHVQTTISNGTTSLSITVDGAAEFTDDDTDIKSMSPNGGFRLEEDGWLSTRTYEVKADSKGNLTRSYSHGGIATPLDDEGRAWLTRAVPEAIRESGIGAGPRVARILHQGGPQAVLAEIRLIRRDGSKRIYIEQMFAQATLNASALKDTARLIRSISSDGDKAQVITTVDASYFTVYLRSYLFDALESIHSDADKRRVLFDIIKKDSGSSEMLARVATAARSISSDGDKAMVLIQMTSSYRPDSGVDMAYFEAANSISSDGDHARVLSKMLASHGHDHNILTRTLISAQRISSNEDKAGVLKEAIAFYSEDPSVRKTFFDAANSISSDGDHQQVLVSLAQKQGVGADTVASIATSTQSISSDDDKARVLTQLAGTNIEPCRDAFFKAANSIHSDGDRSRVLRVVLDRPTFSNSLVIAVIQSASGISSDADKARLLLDAAERYAGDPTVNAALRKAARSLHSDSEYRTVMSRISRHEDSL
jgi:hypothetical protein